MTIKFQLESMQEFRTYCMCNCVFIEHAACEHKQKTNYNIVGSIPAMWHHSAKRENKHTNRSTENVTIFTNFLFFNYIDSIQSIDLVLCFGERTMSV